MYVEPVRGWLAEQEAAPSAGGGKGRTLPVPLFASRGVPNSKVGWAESIQKEVLWATWGFSELGFNSPDLPLCSSDA